MPTVHAADRIGMDRMRQVLRYPSVAPPNAPRVGVVALERLRSVFLANEPLAGFRLLNIDDAAAVATCGPVLIAPPTAEMVRAGDDAGADSFRDPDAIDKVTNFGRDAGQIAIFDAEALGVGRMQPDWIALRDFVEPFGRSAAGVN